MKYHSTSVENLINELKKLPGIGQKTAQRLTFFILSIPKKEAISLAHAIVRLKERTKQCKICFNISDEEICNICRDERRDSSIICVVENSWDVIALEKSGQFKGLYHVLGGVLSPIDNIGPDDIRIRELLYRIKKGKINEVIVATNPNVQGDATAIYIAKLLNPLGIKATRIARGLPVGGDLEYADEVTLGKAIQGRTEIV